jgi:ubiquinone/menaquinone biosynthesis C-methylase UbiE
MNTWFLKIRKKITDKIPKIYKDHLISLMFLKKRIPNYKLILEKLKNCNKIIEIGGPSSNFFTRIPLYQKIKSLDIVNYSKYTIWEKHINQKKNCNYFSNRYGNQIISEAVNLDKIKDNTYDAVLSSHCLEHIANPLKALFEKSRILKSGGYFLLILPKKKNNFDHKRPYTTFEHLIKDYKNNVNEDDLTHYDEIILLHDIYRDGFKNRNEFMERSKENYINRCFHHHVFNKKLIYNMLTYTNFNIMYFIELDYDYVIFAISNKKII